jgi:hypothetical protein
MAVKRVVRMILVAAVLFLCPTSSAFVRQIPSGRATFALHESVASTILLGGPSGDANGNKKPPRLSRPERKALERADKEKASRRKHNFSDRKESLKGSSPGEGRYDLHSRAVATLNQHSTADDVVKAIKRAQNLQ